jgi:hypothetical protein
MCRSKRRDPWSKKRRTNDDDGEAASERTSLGFVATASAAATYRCRSSDGVTKEESSNDVPEGVPQKNSPNCNFHSTVPSNHRNVPYQKYSFPKQVVVVVANCGYLLTYLLLLDFIFYFFNFKKIFGVVCLEGLGFIPLLFI